MVQFAIRRVGRIAMRMFRTGRINGTAMSFLVSMTIACMLYSGDKNAPQRLANVKLKIENVKSALTVRSMVAQDTDGDGITDEWERWTGTDPQVDDALQDMDGDGLTNFDEYYLQCDPQCTDTAALCLVVRWRHRHPHYKPVAICLLRRVSRRADGPCRSPLRRRRPLQPCDGSIHRCLRFQLHCVRDKLHVRDRFAGIQCDDQPHAAAGPTHISQRKQLPRRECLKCLCWMDA